MKAKLSWVMMALLLVGTASTGRADEKSHRAAAEELLKVTETEKNFQAVVDQMLTAQLKANPELNQLKDVMRRFLAKHLSYASLKEDMITIFTSEFTEAELKAAVAFYSTPLGKKMTQKLPTLMRKGGELGAKRVQENSAELRRMIEEELERKRDQPRN